jgi:hypothetical protein
MSAVLKYFEDLLHIVYTHIRNAYIKTTTTGWFC